MKKINNDESPVRHNPVSLKLSTLPVDGANEANEASVRRRKSDACLRCCQHRLRPGGRCTAACYEAEVTSSAGGGGGGGGGGAMGRMFV